MISEPKMTINCGSNHNMVHFLGNQTWRLMLMNMAIGLMVD